MECVDETDDAVCQTYVRSLGYNKFIVPPPHLALSRKLEVKFSLHIREFIEINEMKNFVETKLQFQKTWFDRQLTHQNLKNDKDNLISFSDRELICRAPADREASIKDSGFTRPGSGVTVLCQQCAN